MRTNRVQRFRKYRRRRIMRFLLYTIVIPSTSVFLGYILTNLFILPLISQ